MRPLLLHCGLLWIVGVTAASAYPRPPYGTEDIPKLVADSTLVCKGEVVSAPTPLNSDIAAPMAARASVRMDRCYKGEAATVKVLFDATIPRPGGPVFILRTGNYLLFFLKPNGSDYEKVDRWFGVLDVSRELSADSGGTDPLLKLENDLIAGLRDKDPEQVRNSIRMLGNMKHLHSSGELKALLDTSDLLTKTYLWEALLRLKDYSIMPSVAEFIKSQPPAPNTLLLPRDQIFYMEGRLFAQIGTIRDPKLLPYLNEFSKSANQYFRMYAVDAIRAMSSSQASQPLIAKLSDPNPSIAFSAMQGLIELAGGGPIDWVPSLEQFRNAPSFYTAKCREWWESEGQQRAAARSLNSKAN